MTIIDQWFNGRVTIETSPFRNSLLRLIYLINFALVISYQNQSYDCAHAVRTEVVLSWGSLAFHFSVNVKRAPSCKIKLLAVTKISLSLSITRAANVLCTVANITSGDRVMVLVPRIPEYWLMQVACLRTGEWTSKCSSPS